MNDDADGQLTQVLLIAGGVAARSGVIIKEADALERGHKVTDVVFDKTGTLTTGELTVDRDISLKSCSVSEAEVSGIVKVLVRDITHPVSKAIGRHLESSDSPEACLDNVQSIPGSGITGSWNAQSVKAGNPYWLSVASHPAVENVLAGGLTAFCVTVNADLVAVYGVRSTLRDEASSTIHALGLRGIRCHIASGDHERAVQSVASAVGISIDSIAARSTPAQKKDYVQKLQINGSVVLFCGDGTNDAVAIAQSNVGAQMGTASEVTKSVCSVTLLGGLEGILSFLDVSKGAFRRIVFNFVWSAVYNVFAILLAAGALQAVGFRIPPAYAGLGEIVSVAPVILAALSMLLTSKRRQQMEAADVS